MYTDEEIGYVPDDEDYEVSQGEFDIKNDNNSDYSNNSKKKLFIVIAILIIVFMILLIFSCQNKNSAPSIKILSEGEKIRISESVDLDVRLENTINNKVKWSVVDSKVASIDNNGVVTGLKIGKTNVKAIYNHLNNKQYADECFVSVYRGEIGVPLETFGFKKDNLRIRVGEEAQIELIFTPDDSYVDNITYISKDNSIATVDEMGIVTGINVGSTNVDVLVNDSISKTLKVVVYSSGNDDSGNNDNNSTKPTSIKFNDANMKIAVNQELTLNYTVLPTNAKDYKITFENSNNTVLRISQNGKIKGLSIGKAIVTAKINNNIKTTIEVEVIPYIVYVDNINITSSKNLTLNVGNTSEIIYNVTPNYASNKTVTFTTTNPSVATVDTNGIIKAVGKGTCVITIKTVDGNKTDNININVQ